LRSPGPAVTGSAVPRLGAALAAAGVPLVLVLDDVQHLQNAECLDAVSALAAGPIDTPSIFAPVSTPAFAIRELAFFVLGITAVILVVVGGLAA